MTPIYPPTPCVNFFNERTSGTSITYKYNARKCFVQPTKAYICLQEGTEKLSLFLTLTQCTPSSQVFCLFYKTLRLSLVSFRASSPLSDRGLYPPMYVSILYPPLSHLLALPPERRLLIAALLLAPASMDVDHGCAERGRKGGNARRSWG